MNKNVKKIVSVLLCVIIVFSLFTVTSFAEEKTPVIKASVSGEVAFGNKVELLVSLENMPEFTIADFVVDYNPLSLECLGIREAVKSDAEMWAGGVPEKGKATCSIVNLSPLKGQIDVAIVSFKVINAGDTTIGISGYNFDCSVVPEKAEINISNAGTFDPSLANLDFDYEIVNSEVVITFCNRDSQGDIVIPDTIAGYPVTTIKASAFAACSKITSVVIPDSVTVIENSAFSGCNGLKSVTISGSVKTFGAHIFWACDNLETVVMGEGITFIGESMFSQCNKLKNVTLPDSLTEIGYGAFDSCYLLNQINIPKNVKMIGKSAFYLCRSLDNVVIPDGVTEIGEYTFYDCENLKNITLPKKLKSIGNSAFAGSGIKNINLPSSLTEIGSSAFNSAALEKIVIPYGVKAIYSYAFKDCKNLSEVFIPETVESIGSYAFYGSMKMKSITIPESVTEIGYLAVGYNNEMLPINLFTIYGSKGSEAERYAKNHRIGFVALDDESSIYDVDGDGQVTAIDARFALRASAQLQELTGRYFYAADVDKDGKVTAIDARKILRKAAQLD